MVWVCLNCGAEQKDKFAVCQKCGSVRSETSNIKEKNVEAGFWKEPLGPTY